MRRSQIAAMELFSPLRQGTFALEPYEAAWASEALAVVYIDEVSDGAELDLAAQISIDGLRWIDFGKSFETITKPGNYFLQLTQFGTWLRLAGEVRGGPPDGRPGMIAHFYWDLKE